MKATRFEYRHQTLLHLLLVGLSLLTYLVDRVDWERSVFGVGALLLVAAAALETWTARAPADSGGIEWIAARGANPRCPSRRPAPSLAWRHCVAGRRNRSCVSVIPLRFR
jgi:hypothetical protein